MDLPACESTVAAGFADKPFLRLPTDRVGQAAGSRRTIDRGASLEDDKSSNKSGSTGDGSSSNSRSADKRATENIRHTSRLLQESRRMRTSPTGPRATSE
eukprot:4868598-Prymnesium_polylepis.1